MCAGVVRRDFLGRIAEQKRNVVRAFVPDGDELADAILGQHPFERLPGDVVAVGSANAGGEDHFGVYRGHDAAGRDL